MAAVSCEKEFHHPASLYDLECVHHKLHFPRKKKKIGETTLAQG